MRMPFNPAVRRLVRRELLGNKRRSLALFLLSFLPMVFALMVAVAMTNDTFIGGGERTFGQADARVTFAPAGDDQPASSPSVIDDLALPGNPEILAWSERSLTLGSVRVVESDMPIGEPLLDGYGLSRVLDPRQVLGRAPTASGEVLVSSGFAALVGLDATNARTLIGRSFDWIDDPLEIVGVVDAEVAGGDEVVLVAPGSVHDGVTIALIDWPGERPAIRNFEFVDALSVSFREQFDPGRVDSIDPAQTALVMVGLTVTTGAIATAAWRSSARRRLHDVGILVASGGSTSHVSQIQAGQAALIAMVAAVASVASAFVVFPRVSWIIPPDNGGIAWPIDSIVPVVIVGVLGATLAGWWPAYQSSRVSLAAMLAGRLPQRPTTTFGAGRGVVAIVFGLVALAATVGTDSDTMFIFFGVVGLVLISIGVLPLAGWFFQVLASLGTRLPVAPRLVLRDAARNAGRSTAAVLAIGSVVTAVWAGSMDAEQYRTGNDFRGDGSNAGDTRTDWLVVRDPSAARREATASALSVDIADDRAAGPVRLQAYTPPQRWDGVLNSGDEDLSRLLSEEGLVYVGASDVTAEELEMADKVSPHLVSEPPEGFERAPTDDLVMFRLSHGTNSETFAEDPLVTRISRVTNSTGGQHTVWITDGSGQAGDPDRTTQLVLLAIGLVVSGVVVAAMTMLTVSEIGPDLLVMGDVGASTAFRRRFLALHALLVTGFATAAGLVMAFLIRLMVDPEGGLPIPVDILLGLVAMPFVAAALVHLSMVFVRQPNADRFRLAA